LTDLDFAGGHNTNVTDSMNASIRQRRRDSHGKPLA
jgi:hypothetical protein